MIAFRYLRAMLRLAGVKHRQLTLAVAAGSVTLLSALTLTVLSGWLITRAWQMPPVLDLGVAITAVRALGISRAVFRYLDRMTSHKIALGALTRLRARLFDAIALDASGKAHLLSRGDGLLRLVSDTERVTDLIVRSIVPTGVALVLSVASVIVAGLLHPLAAVIMAAGFLLTGVATPWLAIRASRRGRRIDAEDELNLRIDEALSHRAEFAAAGLGDAHAAATRAASARASAASVAAERPEAVGEGVQSWATGLTAAAVLVLAVLTYTGEPVWLGMLVMLPLAAFESHGQLAKAAVHADEASQSARRLADLVGADAQVALPSAADPQPLELADAALEARNLTCAYGDAVWDFRLEPGERMVVRGPSGCGKTTLLQTVAGLVPAAAGVLTVGGRAVGSYDADVLRASVRNHAEDEWVFATSVRENLKVANPRATDELLWECLDAVGLADWVDSLDLHLADGAGSLSSGQRRRLLLARALCSEAPVLLIDEPTEHIDSASADRLLRMLLSERLPGARADRSVIVVTHASAEDVAVAVDEVSVEVLPAPVTAG